MSNHVQQNVVENFIHHSHKEFTNLLGEMLAEIALQVEADIQVHGMSAHSASIVDWGRGDSCGWSLRWKAYFFLY